MPKKTVNPSQSLKIPKLILPSGKYNAFILLKITPFIIHPYLSIEIYKLNDCVEELGLTSTRISSAVGSE